jgi:hypothetical protein
LVGSQEVAEEERSVTQSKSRMRDTMGTSVMGTTDQMSDILMSAIVRLIEPLLVRLDAINKTIESFDTGITKLEKQIEALLVVTKG